MIQCARKIVFDDSSVYCTEARYHPGPHRFALSDYDVDRIKATIRPGERDAERVEQAMTDLLQIGGYYDTATSNETAEMDADIEAAKNVIRAALRVVQGGE